jgi:hypothetical protein
MITTSTVARLQKNQVVDLTYVCRPRGYDEDDIESGIITGYWTGAIDTWGKYTIRPVDGGDPLYLFADEIIDLDEPEA